MSAVADIFDRDGDGYIDYYEFVAALHPNKDAYKPLTDADKIEDEVFFPAFCYNLSFLKLHAELILSFVLLFDSIICQLCKYNIIFLIVLFNR